MLAIDGSFLRALAPSQSGARAARQTEIVAGMNEVLQTTLLSYQIDTPLRIAHFAAQVAHESDGFCTTEEYASGQAYEGRADLGNTEPGDGSRYKGRGLIQLTGRANYAAFGAMLSLDLIGNPAGVNDPALYLLVSCAFWGRHGLNAHADQDDLLAITRAVNGGLNGLDDRRAYLASAKTLVAALAAGQCLPQANMPVLHRGSQGADVGRLQTLLRTAGYPVAIDDDFGPGTVIAVQHFQAGCGMTADGIAGPATWQRLTAG